jgi:excisionase family DNA binding protein
MSQYPIAEGRDHRNSHQSQTLGLELKYGSVPAGPNVETADSEPPARISPRASSASENQPMHGDHSVSRSNLPMTVKEAARFLGVSPQTVYLWVERKQIPHFRVMGRNIRFLISDLRPFRDQFKQEVENGKTA